MLLRTKKYFWNVATALPLSICSCDFLPEMALNAMLVSFVESERCSL